MQVLAVAILDQRRSQCFQLLGADPALAEGDFFRAADLQALAGLDGLDEVGGFQQRLVSAGIQPRIATAERFQVEVTLGQIAIVEIGDLQLATRRRLQFGGVRAGVAVVEIQAGDRIVRARVFRLSTRSMTLPLLSNSATP